METRPTALPAQQQAHQPGRAAEITPPEYVRPNYRGRGKLPGQVFLLTLH